MMEHMKDLMQREIFGASIEKTDYLAEQDMKLPEWI